jgi:hypothetical protein
VVSTAAQPLFVGSFGLTELIVRNAVPPGEGMDTGKDDAVAGFQLLTVKASPCGPVKIELPEIAVAPVLASVNVADQPPPTAIWGKKMTAENTSRLLPESAMNRLPAVSTATPCG